MIEAGVHFGHQTSRWNPKMTPFIFGPRNGIYIIDLQKTLVKFRKAMEFVRKSAAGGGEILYVGTKPQAKDIIQENAESSNMPYVTERWLGGMLTNFETIRKSVKRLKELETMAEDGTFLALSKKESTKLEKLRLKLSKNLGGIKDMVRLPQMIFIVDPNREKIALKEAIRLGIPVIAIVDTNCDPDGIEYIIPGNDDAVRSIRLITGSVTEAMLDGAREYEMKRQSEIEKRERASAEKAALKQKAASRPEPAKAPAPKAAPAVATGKGDSRGENPAETK